MSTGGGYEIRATGAEARNYNFVAARGPQKTTNVIESIGHLVKSCLGGGVVAIHESYKHCGLWTALFLNIFLGAFVGYCMHILVSSAQTMYGRLQQSKMSYPDLAEATLAAGPFKSLRRYHKCFRYCVDVTIGLDLFGSCCVYTVIMARSIMQLIEGANWIAKQDNYSIRYYIAILVVPCLLLCMITSLKYLAPFSIVADCFIVTIAVSTVVYGIQAASRPLMDVPAYKSLGGVLEYIGVCVFSMEGVGVSLPIENHMTNPHHFYLVLLGGMSVVTGIVMVIGFFGYYGFGEQARSPITLNYPWAPFPIALKAFMVLVIYVTFALNFWVPFDLVWYYLKQRHPENKHWFWERVYRAIFVIVIVGIAVIFPSVSSFMGLLGSFCLSNMGFIFPAFIQLTIEWEDPGLGFMKWRMIRFLFITIFGICLCIMGTYLNAKNMIKAVLDPDDADQE
ncbi:proton-coupled amino acid transporter-like protein acs [Choristoneura fumiferana]|uniref:proton-coupled amino acid transporter-like protein acs n=1 Tax=Choristoneura fumiferana TaxID=7141 RepID=UPI003D15E047